LTFYVFYRFAKEANAPKYDFFLKYCRKIDRLGLICSDFGGIIKTSTPILSNANWGRTFDARTQRLGRRRAKGFATRERRRWNRRYRSKENFDVEKRKRALRRAFLLVGVHFFDKFTLGELKWPLLLMPNLASLAAPVLTPARAARSKSKTSPSSTILAPVAALASTLARAARSPSSELRVVDRGDVKRRG
jgi:hypothetical protein